MKGNSLENLNNYRKIYFGLNTFSILNIYRKLDPFSEIKKENNAVKKISSAELANIIAVRAAVMIFSAILCTVMDILFGVKPVAVVVYSVLSKSGKTTLLATSAVSAACAAAVIAVTLHFCTVGYISVVAVVLWIAVMHLAAYLAVRKKFHRISFEISEEQ